MAAVMPTVRHFLPFVYSSLLCCNSVWWGESIRTGVHILCKSRCFFLGVLGLGEAGMVKSILSSINVSTLRSPEGTGDGFFVVPSSDRRPAAIWLILVHEFTSESLHGFADPRLQVCNISSGAQCLSSGSTLTCAPNLIGCTKSIIWLSCMLFERVFFFFFGTHLKHCQSQVYQGLYSDSTDNVKFGSSKIK